MAELTSLIIATIKIRPIYRRANKIKPIQYVGFVHAASYRALQRIVPRARRAAHGAEEFHGR